jgi:hypothetical protein
MSGSISAASPPGEPVVYDRNAVLTIQQVARGLSISVRSVERADLPTVYIGRLRRYVWGRVLDTITERSQ